MSWGRVRRDLASLPESLAAAGLDYRVALVSFGDGNRETLALDFTADGALFRARLDSLHADGGVESGTSALDLMLDNLTFRSDAARLVVLYTDEDDDLPFQLAGQAGGREPPMQWTTSRRTPLFQARLDATAARLVAGRVRLSLFMNPGDKPAEFQHGSPAATVLDARGRVDVPATLEALAKRGLGASLQGQLLAGGRCEGLLCAAGKVGEACSKDTDCGLGARAVDERDLQGLSVDAVEEIFAEVPGRELCDDGNLVDGDGCDSNCSPTGCGNGVVTLGEDCDDGNAVGGDACSPICTLGCPAVPLTTCRPPGAAGTGALRLRDLSPNSRDRLIWKWRGGRETRKEEFGSPALTDTYTLCLYDSGGLVTGTTILAGGTCRTQPCWRELTSGYDYLDPDLIPDGVRRLRLTDGRHSNARITLDARGPRLRMPSLPNLTVPVVVQLRNDTGFCWEAAYSSLWRTAGQGSTVDFGNYVNQREREGSERDSIGSREFPSCGADVLGTDGRYTIRRGCPKPKSIK